MKFDHEKLDVYRVSIEFVSRAFELCKTLTGPNRHARDQLLRASQSISLNIAEGNGKRSKLDRKRFFEIARGSTFECAAILDVLSTCDSISNEELQKGKVLLHRVASMLSKMTEKDGELREVSPAYGDYEHEHEHEHEQGEGKSL